MTGRAPPTLKPDEAKRWLVTQPGAALLDVVTNPDEVSVPAMVKS